MCAGDGHCSRRAGGAESSGERVCIVPRDIRAAVPPIRTAAIPSATAVQRMRAGAAEIRVPDERVRRRTKNRLKRLARRTTDVHRKNNLRTQLHHRYPRVQRKNARRRAVQRHGDGAVIGLGRIGNTDGDLKNIR